MTHQEINDAILQLGLAMRQLEEQYMENGGEVTEETEAQYEYIRTIEDLLNTEGVDSLGRWLKSKQDEILAAKAEKAAADARIKSLQRTEEYIKDMITRVMMVTGTDKVKGKYYGFTKSESVKSSIEMQALNDQYLKKVVNAAREAGLPDCIDVELKTTTTRLKEANMNKYINSSATDTVRFTKPRAAKD